MSACFTTEFGHHLRVSLIIHFAPVQNFAYGAMATRAIPELFLQAAIQGVFMVKVE